MTHLHRTPLPSPGIGCQEMEDCGCFMFWLAEKEREIEKDCASVSAQGAESLYVLECVRLCAV